MAPPRKSVVAGTGDLENDPERANRTQARAPNPVAEEDPERANRTQARAPNPVADSEDPEVANATQARVPNPLAKKIRAKSDPEKENKTQARIQAPDVAEDDGSYRTGQNYQASDEEIAGSPSMSLEGDGLEALDPEIGSRTKALPALEVDDGPGDAAASSDDEEGADDANATRAGPPLKLEIVGGPDAGKKKKFKGVRMVIGRTPGVDFLLSDQSVSRRHVELIYGDDGVMLKDLGSGNGTKVNGTKVAEKKLEHGDEIAIGKTRIKFVDELAAFKKARDENEKKETEKKGTSDKNPSATIVKESEEDDEAPEEKADAGDDKPAADAPKSERKPTGTRQRPVRTSRQAGGEAGGFAAKFKGVPKAVRLGLVALVAIVLFIFIAGIALRPPPPPPVDPAKVLADQKMQEARNAAREGNFERTAMLVEDAEKLSPGIDKTHLGTQAKEELALNKGLDEAEAAIEASRFEDARKILGKLGKGSVKTDERKAKIQAALDEAEVAYKRAKIDELIAAGEVDSAKALLGDLPVELQAAPAQAIAEFERQLEEQKALEAKDAKFAAINAAARKKLQREQEIQEAFVVVERKFGSGEWDRAASECARVADAFSSDRDIYARAKTLAGQIPSFGTNFDEGIKKYRQGQLAQAAKPLRQANLLYGKIGLKANKWGEEIRSKLGAAAIASGKESLLREDLVNAYNMFKDALAFDPDDSKARAGLDSVAEKAEELFGRAYVEKDRDPQGAVRKFKIVIQVTDAGSSVHEKAKNQLASMAP